jgi:hypothetical protein
MHRRLRRRHWHAGRHALSCRPQLERSRENLRLPIRLGCVQFGLTVKRRRCGKCCAASGWIHHFRLRQLRSEDVVGSVVPLVDGFITSDFDSYEAKISQQWMRLWWRLVQVRMASINLPS